MASKEKEVKLNDKQVQNLKAAINGFNATKNQVDVYLQGLRDAYGLDDDLMFVGLEENKATFQKSEQGPKPVK